MNKIRVDVDCIIIGKMLTPCTTLLDINVMGRDQWDYSNELKFVAVIGLHIYTLFVEILWTDLHNYMLAFTCLCTCRTTDDGVMKPSTVLAFVRGIPLAKDQ